MFLVVIYEDFRQFFAIVPDEESAMEIVRLYVEPRAMYGEDVEEYFEESEDGWYSIVPLEKVPVFEGADDIVYEAVFGDDQCL